MAICGGALRVILSLCSVAATQQRVKNYVQENREWLFIVRKSCASTELAFRLFVIAAANGFHAELGSEHYDHLFPSDLSGNLFLSFDEDGDELLRIR